MVTVACSLKLLELSRAKRPSIKNRQLSSDRPRRAPPASVLVRLDLPHPADEAPLRPSAVSLNRKLVSGGSVPENDCVSHPNYFCLPV